MYSIHGQEHKSVVPSRYSIQSTTKNKLYDKYKLIYFATAGILHL